MPTTPQLAPIVSAAWLESNLELDDSVVLDVRTTPEYGAGHIPNSISVPFDTPLSAWVTQRDGLLLELPEATDLFSTFSAAGITRHSVVVIVGSTGQPPYPQAGATRAAVTLMYAGVKHVSILNGGHPRWVAERRAVTATAPVVVPSDYAAALADDMFVDLDYVAGRIGLSTIVDARDTAVYSGEVAEPWADKAGHIPKAVSLPAPSMWNADGTYKDRCELQEMVDGALGGTGHDDEVIVYCGVGGYASAWLFTLTRVLGYNNVKMYDGSAQEWVRSHDMVR